MTVKRLVNFVVLLCASSMVVFSAGQKDAPAAPAAVVPTASQAVTPAAGPVVLKALYQSDLYTNPALYGVKLIEGFSKEKYPIKVEFEQKATPEVGREAFTLKMAAGERVDLVQVNDPLYITSTAAKGVFMDLDKIAAGKQINLDDGFGQIRDLVSVGGKMYAIPYMQNINFLVYNKDMFDQAGVPYPSASKPMTWKEFREVAKKITSGTGATKKYGATSFKWAQYGYSVASASWGGADGFYKKDTKLSNVKDPVYADSLQFLYDMMYVDGSMLPMNQLIADNYNFDLFASGNFGMMINNTAWIQSIYKNSKDYPRTFKIGVAPIPNDKGELVSWGGVQAFSIPITAKEPAAAFDLIYFNAMRLNDFGSSFLPCYSKVVPDLPIKNIVDGLEKDGITATDIGAYIINPNRKLILEKPALVAGAEYFKIIEDQQTKFFLKQQTLQQTVDNIETLGNKVISDALAKSK